MLEGVVEVVVALAKGEERHEPTVPGGAAVRVGLGAKGVAERIDEERRVMDKHGARDSGDEERAERGVRAAPEPAEDGRQDETREHPDHHVILVLPPHQRVALEVRHAGEGVRLAELEHDPAHVRVEETLRDVVGILLVVSVFVMPPVVIAPRQRGVLERRRAEDERDQPHWPGRLKGVVGEEPVVAQRDAQARQDEEQEEEARVEQGESGVPQVNGHSRQGHDRRAQEEHRVIPIDPLPRHLRSCHNLSFVAHSDETGGRTQAQITELLPSSRTHERAERLP